MINKPNKIPHRGWLFDSIRFSNYLPGFCNLSPLLFFLFFCPLQIFSIRLNLIRFSGWLNQFCFSRMSAWYFQSFALNFKRLVVGLHLPSIHSSSILLFLSWEIFWLYLFILSVFQLIDAVNWFDSTRLVLAARNETRSDYIEAQRVILIDPFDASNEISAVVNQTKIN